ncbi:histidine phosphatase family protein [Aeromicrobium sp. CnD17-E]|uniref:histidine phosphatase family protein n=1 Tax=Aeromicrobium sp. CnD17-E TaxID=2954487 RepID=UPI0020986093|nr:histidine phosphatase family protein [Aeromicrobium sp. CnD17-E]MCO7239978.1 MSMEG_4193 family putative phosphomutase [Aeromicrobium sp. CnD17-E]
MATLVLLRHGRTTANASGVLAGRTPGVLLDDHGRDQVARAGERLTDVPLAAVYSSPMERCRETSAAVLAHQDPSIVLRVEEAVSECDYGSWQGRPLKELAQEPLWKVVQSQPSAAVFPDGESMTTMQARAVEAVRRIDAEVEARHGASAVWVAVSHGDIIKAVLADALGMHLDLFQRIQVDPASISIVRYTEARPYVLAQNTHAGDLGWLRPAADAAATTDAVPGGGAGPGHQQSAADGPGGGAGPRAADGPGGGAGPGDQQGAETTLEALEDGPAELAGPGRS